MTRLLSALGNYASGDRFWDRETEVGDIVRYLVDGQSVLVTGPRRVGKTSVVHRVLAEVSRSRTALFVDVQQHADATELFAALGAEASRDAAAWDQIRRWFGKRLSSAKATVEVKGLKVELQAAMAGSWRDDGRAIVEALAQQERGTVIAVDELPLLVDRLLKRDVAEVELLMSFLRALAEGVRGVRWLVSGSIGLEAVLHRAGLTGMITHLRPYPIDAWDEATTVGAAEALALGAGLTMASGTAQAVYTQLGLGVPYHVQVLMDELRRDAGRRRTRTVTADDVAHVYRGPFLQSAVRAHLLHLESRLERVLVGDSLRLALDILTHTAVSGVTTSAEAAALADSLVEDTRQRAAILREVLEILEHDAYLAREPEGWRFRSRVVRDWWQQGHSP